LHGSKTCGKIKENFGGHLCGVLFFGWQFFMRRWLNRKVMKSLGMGLTPANTRYDGAWAERAGFAI
jgi:hypothetical protein